MPLLSRLRRPALALLPLTLVLAACGGADPGEGASGDQEPPGGAAGSGPGATVGPADQLQVLTSFYPLQFLTERVAGEHAEVTTLTAPGVDPHDLELSPQVVGSLGTADLVVYSAGMQPAVDEAVASQAAGHSLDTAESADLLATEDLTEHGSGHDHDHGHGHSDDEHAAHDHGPEDPHFWLDPERYGQVAGAIGGRLAEIDPGNAAAYQANAAALVEELTALDEEFATGLAGCESREVVTAHEAFGYLTHRYDLHQVGITGISPEAEPSAAQLAEVVGQVQDLGVEAVYTEPLAAGTIAETVANETGAQVLVLDPVEGVTDASPGEDYLEVMRANLDALREGLGCA